MPLIDNNNLTQALTEFKNKLGTPVYVDPMDVKDEHIVEFGNFGLSATQTTGLSSGSPVQFNSKISGNLPINPSTYGIKLSKDKNYRIGININVQNTDANPSTFIIKDITNNVNIGKSMYSVPVTNSTANINTQSGTSTYYTPTSDCEISIFTSSSNVAQVRADYSIVEIEEIAQPVIVEYNKEISNPLVTEPLEYGEFGFDTKPDIATASTLYPLQSAIAGNIPLTSTGTAKLKANKVYKITSILRDDDIDTILFVRDFTHGINIITNTSYSTAGSALTVSTFLTTAEETEIGFYTNTATATIPKGGYITGCKLLIEEFRNNPVNQYGGFESNVLFDGIANANGNFALIDSIDNYDYILIHGLNTQDIPSSIVDITPTMTSNTTPSPYVISSSGDYNTSYQPWKSFDKSLVNGWVGTNGVTTGWIQIYFSSPTTVGAFSIGALTGFATALPKNFSLNGSDDGSTWVTIKSFTNETGWTDGSSRTYFLDSKVTYKYYRLTVTANNGDISNLAIGEFTLKDTFPNETLRLNKDTLIGIKNIDIVTDSFMFEEAKDSCSSKIHFRFTSKTSFNITNITKSGFSSSAIVKVIGVKGQLPTLITGGVF